MSALRQVGSQLLRAGARSAGRTQGSGAVSTQTRTFASGHGHGEEVTYAGLTLHKASKWHVGLGKGMAGVMWFWVMYRFYNDFDHFVYGPAAHLEHELHADAHGKGHH